MLKIIIGGIMAAAAWTYPNHYSPILFVEGMVLLNLGIFERSSGMRINWGGHRGR